MPVMPIFSHQFLNIRDFKQLLIHQHAFNLSKVLNLKVVFLDYIPCRFNLLCIEHRTTLKKYEANIFLVVLCLLFLWVVS